MILKFIKNVEDELFSVTFICWYSSLKDIIFCTNH